MSHTAMPNPRSYGGHLRYIYRVDFLFAAGCGNRTASSPGRLLVNLGGVAAPLGINPAWFALLLAILKWLALGVPKGGKMTQTWHKPPKMGQMRRHAPFNHFAQIRRAIGQAASLEVPSAGFWKISGKFCF